jgi:hypothetical protein
MFRKTIAAFVLISFLLVLHACVPFFRATNVEISDAAEIPAVMNNFSSFTIVHMEKSEQLILTDISFDNENNWLKATYDDVPDSLLKYSRKVKNKYTASYKRKNADEIPQMHLYIDEYRLEGSQIIIPYASIQKIERYEQSIGATAASYTVSAALGVIGVFVASLPIICSCPDVYTDEESNATFNGNLYPGAVYPALERTDYIEIKNLNTEAESLRLVFANNKEDELYTNSLSLLKISHPKDTRVLIAQDGSMHTIREEKTMNRAFDPSGKSQLNSLQERDNNYYVFDQQEGEKEKCSIDLVFNKEGKKEAKLILNLKNSAWSAYAYDQMCESLGKYYPKWQKKQMKKSPEELIEGSVTNGVQLEVFLKTKNGWESVNHVKTVGSMITRDVIVPLDLSLIEGDEIEIRLQAGYRFWSLDYAAMDFTDNIAIETEEIEVSAARDEEGNSHLQALLEDDENYMTQMQVGENITVDFPLPVDVNPDTESFFLKGRGYYIRQNKYENRPDVANLRKLRKKNGFSTFSKDLFEEIMTSSNISMQ